MIIAEIGQNWCSQEWLGRHLILRARNSGADLVKFQLYDEVKLYGSKGHSEVSKDQAKMFFDYGKEVGIEVFFSVFDIERVGWCEEMGVKKYKVASRSIRDETLFHALIETLKPVIQSLPYGKSNMPYSYRPAGWLYLLVIPSYPTSLNCLFTGHKFGIKEGLAGFSDHTIGLDAAKIALARGAEIIEKHFCISHDKGVDAEWSMTPDELRELKRFENVVREVL